MRIPKREVPRFADRFTGRALDYSRYRPGYPKETIRQLKEEIGLNKNWVVADIGSGTGILSELFLRQGNKVFCVEPNDDMRRLAEENLKGYRHLFVSVAGSAEETHLRARSVDLIIAGQALHWFDAQESRIEFRRILRKNGYVAIFYNHRASDKVGHLYESIIERYRGDRPPIPDIDEAYVSRFLGGARVTMKALPNSQDLGLGGLLGRVASASYMPSKDDPVWTEIERDARKLLRRYGKHGKVRLSYDTTVYLGRPA